MSRSSSSLANARTVRTSLMISAVSAAARSPILRSRFPNLRMKSTTKYCTTATTGTGRIANRSIFGSIRCKT